MMPCCTTETTLNGGGIGMLERPRLLFASDGETDALAYDLFGDGLDFVGDECAGELV